MAHQKSTQIQWITMIIVSLFVLSGCGNRSVRYNSSSVVNYLYPDQENPTVSTSIPELQLPLHVGIAFVPGDNRTILSEEHKASLLDLVGSHFKHQDFIDRVEIIPTGYLRPEGSFTNLDQLKAIYGIDVMVLVSFDQTRFTDEGLASLAYWTLVGAYIIPGEKNDTHTLLDAAVYDIASRKFLFRAPGSSHIKGHATPINLSEELRKDSEKGFHQASMKLVANLDQQLITFKQRVKERPKEYKVTTRAGYTGSGSVDVILVTILAGLWLVSIAVCNRHDK